MLLPAFGPLRYRYHCIDGNFFTAGSILPVNKGSKLNSIENDNDGERNRENATETFDIQYEADFKQYARKVKENALRQNSIEDCSNLINFASVKLNVRKIP